MAGRRSGSSPDLNAGSLSLVLRKPERARPSGLPEKLLERVFEPFFRGEPSRNRQTGGSGLGLAIARGIARAHGGDVTLANAPEGGLVATLTLPDSRAGDRGDYQVTARDGGND